MNMRFQRIHLGIILALLVEISLGYYVANYTCRAKKGAWTYLSEDEITCIGISSTGRLIGIGGRNGTISLISRGSSTPKWVYHGGFRVTSIELSAEGDYLVSLDSNGTISLFPQVPLREGGRVCPRWAYHLQAGDLRGIFSSGGIPPLVYVLASREGTIYLLSTEGERLWEYKTGADEVVTTISVDGLWVAVGDSLGNIRLFTVSSGSPIWSFSAGSRIVSIAISFDGNYVAAGGMTRVKEGRIYLLSLKDGELLYERRVDRPIRSVHISYNGEWLVADEEDGTGVIIHYRGGSVHERSLHVVEGIRSIDLSPFGSYMVLSNTEGVIYLYYLPRPAPLWKFSTQEGTPLLAITQRGDFIFVSTSHRLYLLSNTHLAEMAPGSRTGWGLVFFLGLGIVSFLLFVHMGIHPTRVRDSDFLSASIGLGLGTLIGLLMTKNVGRAFLLSGVGSLVGCLICWRSRSFLSFLSGCYIGCFASGVGGFLLGLLTWFGGDERNIVQLTISGVVDGLRMGIVFGILGAVVGALFMKLIIKKVLGEERL